MKYFKPLILFIFAIVLLLYSGIFLQLTLINGLLQILLFLLVVNIPAWITKRMSYVDIAWPLGLVLIGVLVFIFGEGAFSKRIMGGVLFAFMGLRMGLMAVYYWSKGFLNKELPRYEYQRHRWMKEGKTNTDLAMQVEISVQALANISFLAMPALLIAWNPETAFHWLEILGIIIWVLSFCLETIADKQKNAFITKSRSEGNKKAVCNVGLWKYSRHPNYFFEWMVWNALIIIALPSWFGLFNSEPIYISLFYLFAVLMASKMMYTTLVHYTGAKPAEYYSVQKRPEYKAYQQTTSIFFPRKPKE